MSLSQVAWAVSDLMLIFTIPIYASAVSVDVQSHAEVVSDMVCCTASSRDRGIVAGSGSGVVEQAGNVSFSPLVKLLKPRQSLLRMLCAIHDLPK